MAYGLRTFKENGAIALNYTDRLTRVLLTKFLGAQSSGSVYVTGFDPTKGAAFATILNNDTHGPAGTCRAAPHNIGWSGSTVSWTPHEQAWVRSDSWLYVVMYK